MRASCNISISLLLLDFMNNDYRITAYHSIIVSNWEQLLLDIAPRVKVHKSENVIIN